MIGSVTDVANAILSISGGGSFPNGNIAVANAWADVADTLLAQAIPPSTTTTQARTAFISIMTGVTNTPPNGIPLLKSAFMSYAAALALGMTGFTSVPPAVPPMIETVITAPTEDSNSVAYALASLLVTWAATGVATLIAPPYTVSNWN